MERTPLSARARAIGSETDSATPPARGFARLAQGAALFGFALYALAAPHSIAGAWYGLSVATLGWLARTLTTRRLGVRRSPLDLPLWLFFAWSVASAALSAEPRISLAKLGSVSTFLVFYLAQAVLTRRAAIWLAALMITSGAAGALWSVAETVRGRGVVVDALAADSPLRDAALRVGAGDCVWRVSGRRVNSLAELDGAIRRLPAGAPLKLSLVTRGEHVERTGPAVTEEMKARPSPSGVAGTRRTHRFRASGWTRHYETFAETQHMLAQLALGFTFACLQRRRRPQRHGGAAAAPLQAGDSRPPASATSGARRARVALSALAFLLLGVGVALTAMRTALVALAVGALTLAWRATGTRRARALVAFTITLLLALGALAVWRTRAGGALRLDDPSARSRLEVARIALARVPLHPFFGHGMDAMHRHWNEWGFPGSDLLHTHSTPLQIAFDRGLPALVLWLWLCVALWLTAARAERLWRNEDDAGAHGLTLGATGALAGFFASSLVNYNFGDAEVALLLWWLTGGAVVLGGKRAG